MLHLPKIYAFQQNYRNGLSCKFFHVPKLDDVPTIINNERQKLNTMIHQTLSDHTEIAHRNQSKLAEENEADIVGHGHALNMNIGARSLLVINATRTCEKRKTEAGKPQDQGC